MVAFWLSLALSVTGLVCLILLLRPVHPRSDEPARLFSVHSADDEPSEDLDDQEIPPAQ